MHHAAQLQPNVCRDRIKNRGIMCDFDNFKSNLLSCLQGNQLDGIS